MKVIAKEKLIWQVLDQSRSLPFMSTVIAINLFSKLAIVYHMQSILVSTKSNWISENTLEIKKLLESINLNHFEELQKHVIPSFIEILESLKLEELKDLIISLYEKLFNSERAFPNITPNFIKEIIVKLLRIEDEESVFNIECHIGDLLYSIQRSVKKSNKRILLGGICKNIKNLEIARFLTDSHEIIGGEIFNLLEVQKYNHVIVTAPWGEKLENNLKLNYTWQPISTVTSEFAYIFKGLSMNENGLLIAVVPFGVLTALPNIGAFKYLLEQDILETVIALPGEAYSLFTPVRTAIIVINKNKQKNKSVQFIDTKNLIGEDTQKANQLGLIFHEKQKLENISNLVSIKEIQDSGLKLNPEIYTDQISLELKLGLKEKRLIYLDSFVNLIAPIKRNKIKLKTIEYSDLSHSIKSIYLNLDELRLLEAIIEKTNYKQFLIKNGDILIQLIGTKHNATVIKCKFDQEVLIKTQIAVLRPKLNVCSEFLFFQFHAKLIEKQYSQLSNGVTIQRVNEKSLLTLILPNLDFDAQKSSLNQQKLEIVSREEEKLKNIKSVLDVKSLAEEEEFQFIRFLCHDLKPKLAKIKVDTVALKNYIASKGLSNELSQEALTNEDKPKTNGELANGVVQTIEHMSKLLDNIRAFSIFSADDYQKTNCNLESLFNENFIPNFQADIIFEIKINIPKKIKFKIYEPLFIEALNNVFRNAITHGKKEDQNKITVKIDANVDIDNRKIKIIYSNNGHKLPGNLTEKTFTTFGNKRENSPGDGLGGAYIGKVLKIHNAEFFIDKNSLYPVCFIFTLPIEEVI